MLSDERIDDLWREIDRTNSSWTELPHRRLARAIEREASAPLLLEIDRLKGERNKAAMLERNKWMAQINEDEALMRDTLEALSAHSIFKNDACAVAAEALRQRLEAKK